MCLRTILVRDAQYVEQNIRREGYIEDPQKLLESVEAVVIAAEWPQYQKLDYRGKIVVDGRRIEKAREAEIYEGMTW